MKISRNSVSITRSLTTLTSGIAMLFMHLSESLKTLVGNVFDVAMV